MTDPAYSPDKLKTGNLESLIDHYSRTTKTPDELLNGGLNFFTAPESYDDLTEERVKAFYRTDKELPESLKGTVFICSGDSGGQIDPGLQDNNAARTIIGFHKRVGGLLDSKRSKVFYFYPTTDQARNRQLILEHYKYDPKYPCAEAVRFVEKVIMPRITKDGKLIEPLKEQLRFTFFTDCFPAVLIDEIQDYLCKRLGDGISNEEIKHYPPDAVKEGFKLPEESIREALRQVICVHSGPPLNIKPQTKPRFTRYALVNRNDLFIKDFFTDQEIQKAFYQANENTTLSHKIDEDTIVVIGSYPNGTFYSTLTEKVEDSKGGHSFRVYMEYGGHILKQALNRAIKLSHVGTIDAFSQSFNIEANKEEKRR